MFIERTGRDHTWERDLFVLHVPSVQDLPAQISIAFPFVCLLAWDAQNASDDELLDVGKKLVAAGCAYACTWGPRCEDVHDAIDLASAMATATEGRDAFLMTTWHADEPLAQAIWYALHCTVAEGGASCRATLAITIGGQRWAEEIREAFTRLP